MVKLGWYRIRAFCRREDGLIMVEGVIVLPLVLLTFAALIEFGFGVYQWNQTVKAMQLGARLAAVSEPVPANISVLETDYPALEGGPVPSTSASIVCRYEIREAGATGSCVAESADGATDGLDAGFQPDSMAWLLSGDDATCDPSQGSRRAMCDINPRLVLPTGDTANPLAIVITYHRSGLGYVGRPAGPVVTITVSVEGLKFNLPLVGGLIGLNNFEIPANPVTVTSEDLCTQNSC